MSTETEQLEEWRAVIGYEGRYEVSSLGRIRSLDHAFWHDKFCVTMLRKGRVLKLSIHDRYVMVSLHSNSGQVSRTLHSLVLEAFKGPCPEGHVGRHLDGNRLNNRKSNLDWGTPAQNSADMIAHGHSLRGEKHHQAKLTWADVCAIRAEKASGVKRRHLAHRYGVSRGTITQICAHKTWKEAANG